MNNVLLFPNHAGDFGDIIPKLTVLVHKGKAFADAVSQVLHPDWDSVVLPLSEIDDQIGRILAPLRQVHGVSADRKELDLLYEQAQNLLLEYGTTLGQHTELYRAFLRVSESISLTTPRKKVLENALREFRLSGIDLNPEERAEVGATLIELNRLCNLFERNVVHATDTELVHVELGERIEGISPAVLAEAQQRAVRNGKVGYLFRIDRPTQSVILTNAHDRHLREEVYKIACYRTSSNAGDPQGPDNGPVIEQILSLRLKLSRLLGFPDYASYSLERKMVEKPSDVLAFLDDLSTKAYDTAQREFSTLVKYGAEHVAIDHLEPWDIAYVSELLKEETIQLSDTVLRAYFPLPVVISGLQEIIFRVYGVKTRERQDIQGWHQSVRCYEVLHEDSGEVFGAFYVDLFAREGKRGGAWMDECVSRYASLDGDLHLPIAYLNCNFTDTQDGTPSLLNFREVETLFHEMGHVLHHLIARQTDHAVSGIAGVEWDAVEVPSQYFENFASTPEGLVLISQHIETGHSLPENLVASLQLEKKWQAGLALLRQNEYSIVDFRAHLEKESGGIERFLAIIDEVRGQTRVTPVLSDDRSFFSFTHIFGGDAGYAAGYYGYKWAEVMAADIFEAFLEEGDWRRTGTRFATEVLAFGGARKMSENFRAFRGRDPSVDALLHSAGLGTGK